MDNQYNDKVVRQFAIATVLWGVVGMLVGVVIAAQLAWPALNFDIPWLTYGRLRPLHTNGVIFAFGISGLFATSYYVVQRTCQVRLCSDKLAAFTFWGWQAVILLAVDFTVRILALIFVPKNRPVCVDVSYSCSCSCFCSARRAPRSSECGSRRPSFLSLFSPSISPFRIYCGASPLAPTRFGRCIG